MKSRIYIEAFDCVTSTGYTPESFWSALLHGISGLKKTDTSLWPERFQEYWKDQNHLPHACTVTNLEMALSTLTGYLSRLLKNVMVPTHDSIGIIFSSTKGAIEDLVWMNDFSENIDPLELVLSEIQNLNPEFNFSFKQVVSNSCASSHASVALAKKWIQSGACQKVLIIAGDVIGPFIHTGFQSLRALSVESAKPFQEERDGLVLGEAFTAIVLSTNESEFELLDCQVFNEAHTVTGASPEGRGLLECIKRLEVGENAPDFSIAHGTATFLNDQIEDKVMASAQKIFAKDFAITGTKWSVGHSFGARGSVDMIAAMMSLKNQQVFSLNAKNLEVPKSFQAKNYILENRETTKLECALVTTLGFGGTNGALMIKLTNKKQA
jgi:3-oxoacyl-[acyl-carrier-protein] synthase-1